MIESPHFCVLPFVGLCIEAGGRFKPCCKYQSWDSSLDATQANLTQLMESQSFEKIRQEMLNGKKHEGCRRCWQDEEAGITSFRQSSNEQHKDLLDGFTPTAKVIDFGFGNTCNAACITCESSSSRKWSEEDKMLTEVESNKFQRLYFPPVEDQFHWSLEDYKNIKQITHTQNEVFASSEFPKFLENLQKNSNLSEKSILISTNASIWPDEKVLEQLKEFKKCQIQLSIDGLNEHNEYIRYPLKWEKVSSIVEKWVDFSDKTKIQLTARCTVSIYNVLYLKKLSDWWREISQGRNMSFGYCWYPSYLNPSIFFDKLWPHLKDQVDQFPILRKVEKPIKDIEKEKSLFWDFTERMDSNRKLKFKSTFRELNEIIGKE